MVGVVVGVVIGVGVVVVVVVVVVAHDLGTIWEENSVIGCAKFQIVGPFLLGEARLRILLRRDNTAQAAMAVQH